MKKWIFISLSVLIVIFIVLLIVTLSNLGPIIKNAVNKYGPQITKTEVRLGDVGISLLSAEVKLKDFYLGNPKGFNSPYALKVGSIYVDANESSLTGKTIIIDKIELVRPDIVYEKIRGTDNFQSIIDNMKTPGGSSTSSKEQSDESGSSRKIIIKDFIVRDGEVQLAMSMLGEKSIQAKAKLPEIHLRNIGEGTGGLIPAEAFKEILTSLYGSITSPTVVGTLSEEIKKVKGSAIETLTEGSQDRLKNTTKKLKGLFGK